MGTDITIANYSLILVTCLVVLVFYVPWTWRNWMMALHAYGAERQRLIIRSIWSTCIALVFLCWVIDQGLILYLRIAVWSNFISKTESHLPFVFWIRVLVLKAGMLFAGMLAMEAYARAAWNRSVLTGWLLWCLVLWIVMFLLFAPNLGA